MEIKIDKENEYLKKYDWRVSPDGYARATINGKRWFLHRYLMKPSIGKEIDHINGDRLDNRKSNLRICSRKENARNSKPQKNKKYSKFKGVSYCSTEKRRKRWVAACEVNEKRITIGRFYTEEEARQAYNKKSKELFGVFARGS